MDEESTPKGSLSEEGKMFFPAELETARQTYLNLIERSPEREEELRSMFKRAYGVEL